MESIMQNEELARQLAHLISEVGDADLTSGEFSRAVKAVGSFVISRRDTILAALATRPTGGGGSGEVERVARALYACEKERSDRTDAIISAAKGKTVTVSMEPWEECWQVFHDDAKAAIEASGLSRKAAIEAELAKVCAWLREHAPQYGHEHLARAIEAKDYRNV